MVYLGEPFPTEQDAELNSMWTPDLLLEPGAELSVFEPLKRVMDDERPRRSKQVLGRN